MRKLVLFGFAVLLAIASLPLPAISGDETPVQQTAARVDAARQVSGSHTTAATVTLTPNGGQTVYIFSVDVQNCAGASAVTAAGPTHLTTTNLGSFDILVGSGVAAGLCQPISSWSFPTGLQAATPGTAVTFVLPTFATNQTVRLNVAWGSAPAQ